jgi:anti-anti-sigma regulatory factor
LASIQIIPGPAIHVDLEGEFGIALAGELKEKLSTALAFERNISVSLAGVSTLDVTAFQLLWAAAAQARTRGRAFTFTVPVPDHILVSLTAAGLPCTSLLEAQP